MKVTDYDKAPGHWIFAQMGKRVLRPGGKELTQALIKNLDIQPSDNVIEFAPGLGYTANLALQNHPSTYIGVDVDSEAITRLTKKMGGSNRRFVNGNAGKVDLVEGSSTKLYGESMLTMHADHRKTEIIREAYRLLEPGGMYAIHELGLAPDSIDPAIKKEIQQDLAKSIRVNARPLTVDEWTKLLEDEGFEIIFSKTNGMHLLENKRVLDDEGFFRTLKIGYNVLTHPKARKRILEMRKVFRTHEKHMNAVVLVAKKYNYNADINQD